MIRDDRNLSLVWKKNDEGNPVVLIQSRIPRCVKICNFIFHIHYFLNLLLWLDIVSPEGDFNFVKPCDITDADNVDIVKSQLRDSINDCFKKCHKKKR